MGGPHKKKKKKKTCFNRGTNDLDQQMACGAPVRWLKYTTGGGHKNYKLRDIIYE